jgi:hypothetical protein
MKEGLYLQYRPSLFVAKPARKTTSAGSIYRVVGLVRAGSLAGRFGKLGVPGDGGTVDGATLTRGLNSLA